MKIIRRLRHLNQSLLIGRVAPLPRLQEGTQRRIDIWWGGLQRNGDLMLILAHQLSCDPEWRDSKIRVLSMASCPLMHTTTENFLRQLIPKIRIDAESRAMLKKEPKSFKQMILVQSSDADLVALCQFLPGSASSQIGIGLSQAGLGSAVLSLI